VLNDPWVVGVVDVDGGVVVVVVLVVVGTVVVVVVGTVGVVVVVDVVCPSAGVAASSAPTMAIVTRLRMAPLLIMVISALSGREAATPAAARARQAAVSAR
jgi:hypothetical protein